MKTILGKLGTGVWAFFFNTLAVFPHVGAFKTGFYPNYWLHGGYTALQRSMYE